MTRAPHYSSLAGIQVSRLARSGFTLIEVLIALAILGVIAVLGYRGLSSLTDSEVKLTAALKASFDYCATALGRVDDSKLTDQVPFFGGRQVTRVAAMIALSNDWADHYAAQAMYLRLNGLLPPTAQKSSGTK